MSNTNCIICGSEGKSEQCKTCLFKGCKKCADSHKDFCMILKKDKCHFCKDHDEYVNGYCFGCFHLTCRECVVDNHLNHNILPICQAVHNIRSDIQSSIEELEVKMDQEQIVVDNVPIKQNEFKILLTRIDEEERKLLEILIATKSDLLVKVEKLIKIVEVQCSASKAIVTSMTVARDALKSVKDEKNIIIFLSRWSNPRSIIEKQVSLQKERETDDKASLIEQDITSQFLDPFIRLSMNECSNSNGTSRYSTSEIESSSFNLNELSNIKDKSDVASVDEDDVLEEDFVNITHPTEVEERNKTALKEECISLHHQIKSLQEKIINMDKCLSVYKDEKEYIVTNSKRLQELIVETTQKVNSKDLIEEILFPETATELKDMFTGVYNSVIKSVKQLKHELTERTVELNEKCVSVANWTDKQREEINTMHMKYEKDLYEKDGKLSFYMEEFRSNEKKMKELHSTIYNLRKQCGKLQQQSFELQKILERERQQLNIEQENAELKTRLKKMDNWITQQQFNTEKLMSTIEQLRLQISKFEQDLQSVKSEKDDLQTRLSSIAGEKLTKGNPSITDLGDPNRPMKIGEKYGELYDNEWTDAMESVESIQNCFPGLKKAEQEEIVIHHMYRLLMCCFRECRNISMQQIQNIGQTVAEAMCLNIKSEEELSTLPGCKEVQIYRRQNSEGFANYLIKSQIICKDVFENWDYSHKSEIVLQELITTPFFHKCVHLCWSMAIQDPLMYLAEHLPPDTKFDKNVYKEFVKSGDKVKFMVWPALYLHKDGPLLHKGVVQAYW